MSEGVPDRIEVPPKSSSAVSYKRSSEYDERESKYALNLDGELNEVSDSA
jgi:hypothetical protein